ncbi:MAG: ABC transporter permease [Archangiaceae bacterium]|nr:ABC transporter permease [Archangiaceae bacterium]
MREVLIIALTGFTEARRNQVTVLIAAFTLLLILSTSVILNLAIFTLDRVATDFGLGVMSLLLVGLAIFLSSGQLTKEIERRTIFLVLSRPVSRAQFVVGRTFGTVLTLWVLQAIMSVVFLIQLNVLHIDMTMTLGAALVGLSVELVVLCAIGAVLSSSSGPIVASSATVGLYLIGHGAGDLYAIAQRSKSELIRVVGKGLYWLIPQLDRLDYKLQASYGIPVAWSDVAVSSAYGFGYAIVAMVAAIVIFERIDFK